jgi:heat-inducible transcriptional repressor
MNSEERRIAVLRAIVADFVATNEPVGSKGIVDRHNLGVSSATVRNDMAALEDEGYIIQPHTSAGRIPTDKGYRLFVDRLAQIKPLSGAERKAISTFLEGAVDLDDVLRRSVRLLAQLTRQVAVVQYPTLSRSTVRHLEVVALTPARLMLVLITDTGRVDQRVVDLGDVLTDDDVGHLRGLLNAVLVGQPLTAAAARVAPCPRTGPTTCARSSRRCPRCWWSRWSSTPRSVSCSAAPPTSPARVPTPPRCAGSSRRWRSRWSCCGC